jgi:hypothetical protein
MPPQGQSQPAHDDRQPYSGSSIGGNPVKQIFSFLIHPYNCVDHGVQDLDCMTKGLIFLFSLYHEVE